ncbi:MAG: D-alanyl-D-alanine carboxypeptidase [Gammaproteobacteria bacterium]|nr:D-alanyl-D-alanine carboxypeptidase [Gammaproteobacteria bacterium]MBM2830553.1 D-alanyl-D-alanine carboxypeptidase [Gammaproteobacteria bacterium]
MKATLGLLTGMNAQLTVLGILVESISARSLQACEEATELVCAEIGSDGKEHLLTPAAAEAWRRLRSTATAEGITLFIVSAFRSIDRQVEIIRQKLDTGVAVKDILTVCAPPGFSEHHTGRAVDLSTPGSQALEVEFEQTTAYAWLTRRAGEFGCRLSYPVGNPYGYQYEPWHWCFHDTQTGSAADTRGIQRHV